MAEANFFEVWGKESPETMQAFMGLAGTLEKSGVWMRKPSSLYIWAYRQAAVPSPLSQLMLPLQRRQELPVMRLRA